MTVRARAVRPAFGVVLAIAAQACSSPDDAIRAPSPEPADLVLLHGNVVTVDDALGTAQAIAVRGDRIAAVGSDAAIGELVGPSTRVIDLHGATAVPGFIEGHGHFTAIGEAMQTLDLMHVRSWDEVVAMVAAAAEEAQPGEWIVGRGWHQEKWDHAPANQVEGFPTHEEVSNVSPDNPVQLTHASGHAAFFNQKAMELAGVDGDTPDPAGGEILRDAQGRPTGVFRETAQALVANARAADEIRRSPRDRAAALRRAIALAEQDCLAKGVTSFQDAGSSFRTIDVLRAMADTAELRIRLWVMVRESNERMAELLPRYRTIGAGNGHLTVRAIKRTIDGALGARGAWLLEPYADSPQSTGLATASVASVEGTAKLAAAHDYQLCVHAIGDRANREVLDIFERAFASYGGDDRRWRVEHAQHLHPDDISRFAALGVIASMQGIHCTSDAPYVIARLGTERARSGAYAWRSLLRSGAVVTNGTDAPVEDVDPIACFHASVTRQTRDGSRFFPEQRMTRGEALRSYTVAPAYAAFEEDIKGSLTPGKLADIAVLSRDITTVPDDELLETEVLWTIVGGDVVYRK